MGDMKAGEIQNLWSVAVLSGEIAVNSFSREVVDLGSERSEFVRK